MTGPAEPLRLTWVQPEDLIGHELRQAAEDGRDAAAVAAAWRAEGGPPPPPLAGASPAPAPPALRALALRLLDELAALPSPLAPLEPTELSAVRALCPDWPAPARRTAEGTTAPQPGPHRTAPAGNGSGPGPGAPTQAMERPGAGDSAPAPGPGAAPRPAPRTTEDGTAPQPGPHRPAPTGNGSGPASDPANGSAHSPGGTAADAPGERPLPARALASSLPPGTASGGRQVPAPAGEVAGAGGHVPPEGPGAVPPRGGGDTSTPPHGHPVPAGTATAPGPSAHSRTGTAREAHDTTTPPHGHPVPAGADAPGGPGNREHGHAPPPWEGVRAPRRTTTAPLPEPTVPGPGQVGPPLPEQPQPHPGGPPGDRPGHRTDDGPDDGCAGADGTGCAHGGAGYTAALHAAWLGRAVGCLLGKPVEKLPLQGIRAIGRATGNWPLTTWFTARGLPADVARAHPFNRRSAPTSLAENIDGMPEDDDLDYPLLNLLLLQRHGQDFHTTDVARLWLDELPAGRTFTAERIAYRNLLSGVEPPLTARVHNPFREWIGAAIRADVHGWTHPGDPGAAAAQAHRDAVLSHTASGVHGAMFLAAVIASAAGGGHDVHRALAEGLRVVPPGSRLARAVRFGVGQARAETCFDTVVDRLHTAYGHYHWVHTVPNAALLAAALTHADGDFSGSICRAVSGGWDTDSNGATAGSIAGLLARRPDALPERWTAPLKNRLATSVAGFSGVGGVGFDTLARLTHREACRP